MHCVVSPRDWLCTHFVQRVLKSIFLPSVQHTATSLTVLAKGTLSKGAESFSSHWCQSFPFGRRTYRVTWVCPMTESEGFLVQSSAITSASSSGSPVRDRFALTLSFSSNFLLRLRSSSLMFALSEGPSSSESTISTSSCSCAYIKEKEKDG